MSEEQEVPVVVLALLVLQLRGLGAKLSTEPCGEKFPVPKDVGGEADTGGAATKLVSISPADGDSSLALETEVLLSPTLLFAAAAVGAGLYFLNNFITILLVTCNS